MQIIEKIETLEDQVLEDNNNFEIQYTEADLSQIRVRLEEISVHRRFSKSSRNSQRQLR